METFIWKAVPLHERGVYKWMLVAFFCVVGTYWLVRPLKTGMFVGLVGVESEPAAKLGTLFILFPILMGYAKLMNFVESPRRLVFIVCSIYAVLFAGISLFCMLAFSEGTEPGSYGWLGWLSYWTIESFGSVCVAMLWSVMASVVTKGSAHTVYPIIIIVCQVGAILGATSATYAASTGFAKLFALAGAMVVAAIVSVNTAFFGLRMAATTAGELIEDFEAARGRGAPRTDARAEALEEPRLCAESETGLLEGLRLVFDSKYVFGIFVISTFCEVIATIMDYQMKVVVREAYSSAEEVAAFMGFFGQLTNGTSLLFALLGTQAAMNTFGLRFCLLAYPLGCLAMTLIVLLHPSLMVLVSAMVCLKSFNYSLNNPSKELLYLRTSHAIKYRAKSWIDMFGTRGAKSIASIVNHSLKTSKPLLLQGGSLVSAAFVFVWLAVASRLGYEHADLVARNAIIGGQAVSPTAHASL